MTRDAFQKELQSVASPETICRCRIFDSHWLNIKSHLIFAVVVENVSVYSIVLCKQLCLNLAII